MLHLLIVDDSCFNGHEDIISAPGLGVISSVACLINLLMEFPSSLHIGGQTSSALPCSGDRHETVCERLIRCAVADKAGAAISLNTN
jgi:hypothetical protein